MNIAVVENSQLEKNNAFQSKGLKRIAISDSYLGKVRSKIEVDGPVHIAGSNAEGKTSTLLLVPLFLGLRPERIINPSKGTFLSYCLPTQRSLIAFEYYREGGLCTVVIFANQPRNAVYYRFIKGGFDETIFHEAFVELHESLKNTQETLKKLSADPRFEMSVQIHTHGEYEAVLCNQQKRLARKSNLLSEMNRFSLCGEEYQLNHLADLTFATVSRKKLHTKMTEMIGSIFNVGQMAADLPDDKRLPELIATIKTLNRFRKNRDKFLQGIELGQLTRNLYADLLYYQTKASELHLECGTQARVLSDQRFSLVKTHNQEFADLQHKKSTISTHRSTLEGDLESVRKRLEKIDADQKYYESIHIEGKRHEYSNLQGFETKVATAKKHLHGLQSQNEDIKQDYQGQLLDLEENTKTVVHRLHKDKERLSGDIESLHAKQRHEDARITKEMDRELAESRKSRDDVLKAFHVEIQRLSKELGRSRQPTAEEQAELDNYKDQMGAAQADLDLAEQSEQQAIEDHKKSLKEYEQAQAEIHSLQECLQEANALLRDYNAILHPAGTVLSALRKKLSGNEYQAAITLIDKSLLYRNDIRFEVVDDSETFFGLSFDIANIEQPVEAKSDEELLLKIADQKEVIESLNVQLKLQLKQLEQCREARDRLQHEVAQALSKKNRVRDHLGQLDYQKEQCLSRINLQAQIREQEAQQKINDAEKRLDDQEKQYKKQEQNIRNAATERKEALGINKEIQQLEENRRRINADIDTAESSYETERQQLEQAYHAKLQERGVDIAVLADAEQGYKKAQAEYERVSQYGVQIKEYESWYEAVFKGRQGLIQQRQDLIRDIDVQTTKYEDIRREIAVLTGQHEKNLQEIDGQIALMEKREHDLSGFIQKADQSINDVIYVEPSKIVYQDYELFIQAAHKTLSDYLKNLGVLRGVIQTINSVLDRERQSLQYREWERLKEQHVEHFDKPNYNLLLIADLDQMMKENIPLAERNARITFSSICQRMNHYFDSMRDFRNRVAQVSRKLSNEIEMENTIPKLTDIKLTLKTVFDESMQMYKHMQLLKDRFNKSSISVTSDLESGREVYLPDDSFMNLLCETMSAIHGANLGSRKKSELLHLEIILKENGRPVVLNSDETFDDISSNGISRLAIVMIYTALGRYLNRDPDLKIHVPFDELGDIDLDNTIALFIMLQKRNINLVCAQPVLLPFIYEFFNHRYAVARNFGFRRFNPQAVERKKNPLLEDVTV